MDKCKKLVMLLFLVLGHLFVLAQKPASEVSGNEGFMRSEAKLYVVMVVVITILAGLLFFMVRLDNKISKFEKGDKQ